MKQLTPQTRLLTVHVRGNQIIQLPVRPGDTPETVMDRLSRIATPPFGEREIRQMVLRSIAMNPEPWLKNSA